MKQTLLFVAFFFATNLAFSQPKTTWNGKSCAVVLTYDDGLDVHLKYAVPALDSAGLKGTFYIADYGGKLQGQIPGWRAAAKRGHELANHTVFHPCEGGRPGREFVTADYDLTKYSFKRINDEIREMNTILFSIDGKTKRTFAFPCSDTKIHDTAYIDQWRSSFVAARAVRNEIPVIGKADLFDLPCYAISGQTGQQLVALVRQAMQTNGLLIFLFHGVGGEHSLNVSLAAHHELLQFLKTNKKDIWVAPLMDVANFVKAYQAKAK